MRVPGLKIDMSLIFWIMLIFIPVSILVAIFTDNLPLLFTTSILAIVPLARVLGYATKEISLQTNPTIGGLVSATFGNAIELIIAVLALSKGLMIVVKASIIGSILGNLLLLIGLSIFFGGLKFKEQKFNKDAIGVSATMLIIAIAGLAIPTIYAQTPNATEHATQLLSDGLAIVLALTYVCSLIFALYTHKHLFDASDEIKASHEKPTITLWTAGVILLIAMVLVTIESEFLVRGIEQAAHAIGWTETFIGVVVIAIVTNIAEKASAIHFAVENKLDISLEIGMSSAIQIALFVVPLLVLISEIFNYGFSLVFSIFEIISIVFSVMIINYLSSDGRCNWLEGIQLLSIYFIIVVAFYFI